MAHVRDFAREYWMYVLAVGAIAAVVLFVAVRGFISDRANAETGFERHVREKAEACQVVALNPDPDPWFRATLEHFRVICQAP